jgi:predicted nucleotidyltransferase
MDNYMSLNKIVEKYNIQLLLTFGSFNTDRFTRQSDIDVGFLSKRDLSIDEESALLGDLIMYFKRDKIDLVNLLKTVPLLLYEIACNSRVLYEEDNSYLRIKLKASSRYADTKFLRDLRREYIEQLLNPIDM